MNEHPYYILISTLAGVAQWIECQPVNQKVTGLIPSQDTYLGYRSGPQEGASKREPISPWLVPKENLRIVLSSSFSLPSPLYKNK